MSRGFGRVRCSCHSPIPPVTPRRTSAKRWRPIGGALRKIHFLALDLPHSDGCFVAAYPAETTEAFCDGHNAAFAFFGGVPRSILYDNTKLAVARILGDGKQRTRVFTEPVPLSVRGQVPAGRRKGRNKAPGRGTGFIRRNEGPRPACRELRGPQRCSRRTVPPARLTGAARLRGHKETIGERLERDRQVLWPLPPGLPMMPAKAPWTGEFAVAGALPRNDYSVPSGLRPP